MDGGFRQARRRYAKHLEAYPHDELARLEMACTFAAASAVPDARRIVDRFRPERLPPEVEARFRMARAYINVKLNPKEDVRADLEAATSLDPSFPLAHLSLGRHLLWRSKDGALAKDHLRKAAALAPGSQGAGLGVVAAEVENGNYREASKLSVGLLGRFPVSIRVWLASALTLLLSSPLNGRLLLAIIAIALFVGYLGPLLLAAVALVGVASLVSLRRVSPRLAIFPSLTLIALVLVYAVRGIVIGRLYP